MTVHSTPATYPIRDVMRTLMNSSHMRIRHAIIAQHGKTAPWNQVRTNQLPRWSDPNTGIKARLTAGPARWHTCFWCYHFGWCCHGKHHTSSQENVSQIPLPLCRDWMWYGMNLYQPAWKQRHVESSKLRQRNWQDFDRNDNILESADSNHWNWIAGHCHTPHTHIVHTAKGYLWTCSLHTGGVKQIPGFYCMLWMLPSMAVVMLWFILSILRYLPAHEMAAALGPKKSMALPSMRAFNRCVIVSSFAGQGRRAIWDIWEMCEDVTPHLSH